MKTNPSDVFQRLRPTCVKLSSEPTRSNVRELRNAFDGVESSSLAKLTEYLLFPLQLTLQRNGISNELKQDVVDCIEVLLRKVKVDKLNVFDDLFNLLTVSLSAKEAGKVANISEELKLSIIRCLNSLINSSGLVIRSVIYRDRYLPSLGHAVSLLLAMAEQEKARNLQVAALSCLRKISFCDSQSLSDLRNGDEEQHDELGTPPEEHEMLVSVYDSAASTMASFLPGISMALTRIICGDPTQGHVVLSSSIDIFGDLVSMVMNDRYMDELDNSEDGILSKLSALVKLQAGSEIKEHQEKTEMYQKEQPTKTLKVNLNEEWFTTTAIKLQVLIEKLTSASISHSNWRVRLSVVKLCEKILSNCTKSMPKSTSLLVDILVGFLEDEYSQVSTESKAVLEYMSKNEIKNEQTSFSSVLEENLHYQLTALPRVMRTADDEKKLRTLNLLNGYIGLLGDRFSLLLTSTSHLKRLSLAFIQVLELDVSDVGIVEKKTSPMHESAVIPSDTHGQNPLSFPAGEVTADQYPRYPFRHFTDDKIRNALCHSCNLLGCHGNLALLVDHFLDLFQESEIHRKQVILILNEIILGSTQREKKFETKSGSVTEDFTNFRNTLKSLVEILLSMYTSEKNWNLCTSNSIETAEYTGITPAKNNTLQVSREPRSIHALSYKTLNSNIFLTCLLLEGIGVFACALGPDFDIFLIETLYLVLSKLGDSNAAVSRSAYGTLVSICQSCGYSSVEELITQNADYLVNSIAKDLKYVFINQQSPRVLQVMLQYSSPEVLAIIEDTLNDIFTVLDLYPDQIMISLVKVLNTLVCSLHKWFAGYKSKQQQAVKKLIPKTHCSEEKLFLRLKEDDFVQKVKNNLQQYIKRKRIVLGEADIEEEDAAQDNKESEDEDLYSTDEKPKLPLHARYATQVLEKCIHFLSNSSFVLRILVLDTVYHGVLALKERENDLLPMIHHLWPPLMNRLNDKDQVVVIKAIDVITTMAECSGDFMRRRVIKDVIPRLLTYLNKQAEVSVKAGPVYTHSQAYKLQVASLKGLGRLCKQLEISELQLDAAACVCSLYLSCRQPVDLQQIALQIFEIFFTLEPDVMWLILNNMFCPQVPQPPHPMFAEVKLAGVKPECKEFASNITSLLRKLEEYPNPE
uniref:TELO2-interacting protein 1 homolog isoform X2 n=1 Tax=Actinia tenebrosa TaxID=6105 RepID=A0A6P8IMY9_ACTTE